jgi:hypothetical protein
MIECQRSPLLFLAAVLAIAGATATHAQVIDFSAGYPMIEMSSNASGTLSHQESLVDIRGRQVGPAYDGNGRLTTRKAGEKLSVSDPMIRYSPDGRLFALHAGNGYEVVFHYRADGGEQISDQLGNSLTRVQNAPGQFVLSSAVDPQNTLTETVKRAEQLFARTQPVSALNSVSAAPQP